MTPPVQRSLLWYAVVQWEVVLSLWAVGALCAVEFEASEQWGSVWICP